MEIVKIIFDIIGSDVLKDFFKQLFEKPENLKWLEDLIKKADKDTIYAICLVILAMRSNDSGVIRAAVEALAEMKKNSL
jgi:hypothetical protein